MNYNKLIRTGFIAATLLLCGGIFNSCSEDISPNKLDEGNYNNVNGVYSYVRNYNDSRAQVIELRKEKITTELYVSLSKAADKVVDATLKIDENLLTEYNAQNGSTFPMLPIDLVSLEEQGALVIAPGDTKSDPLTITITPGSTLTEGTTYALPIGVELKNKGIVMSKDSEGYIILIKALGAIPSTDKGTGIITICYIECNGNNPLNAGEWRLKNSKKPLIDIVQLFAANINYIEKTGRVGVTINSNLQHILSNRDKYIKPLQDMGMKVCLTVMGNHDGTGVANLSDEAAREFAAELKAIVDTYGLDGIDYDDEWSDYSKYPLRPGCVKRGAVPYSRLCYETKRAMPDKLCTVYYIGAVVPDPGQDSFGFNQMVDGMMPADFVDYSYSAQYGSISLGHTTILGMEKKNWGVASIDLTGWDYGYNLKYVRDNNYGVQVIYDLGRADKDDAQARYSNTFNLIAQKLYDDSGITFSGVNHKVDW